MSQNALRQLCITLEMIQIYVYKQNQVLKMLLIIQNLNNIYKINRLQFQICSSFLFCAWMKSLIVFLGILTSVELQPWLIQNITYQTQLGESSVMALSEDSLTLAVGTHSGKVPIYAKSSLSQNFSRLQTIIVGSSRINDLSFTENNRYLVIAPSQPNSLAIFHKKIDGKYQRLLTIDSSPILDRISVSDSLTVVGISFLTSTIFVYQINPDVPSFTSQPFNFPQGQIRIEATAAQISKDGLLVVGFNQIPDFYFIVYRKTLEGYFNQQQLGVPSLITDIQISADNNYIAFGQNSGPMLIAKFKEENFQMLPPLNFGITLPNIQAVSISADTKIVSGVSIDSQSIYFQQITADFETYELFMQASVGTISSSIVAQDISTFVIASFSLSGAIKIYSVFTPPEPQPYTQIQPQTQPQQTPESTEWQFNKELTIILTVTFGSILISLGVLYYCLKKNKIPIQGQTVGNPNLPHFSDEFMIKEFGEKWKEYNKTSKYHIQEQQQDSSSIIS